MDINLKRAHTYKHWISFTILGLIAVAFGYYRYRAGSAYLNKPAAELYMLLIFLANTWISFFLVLILAVRSRICAYVILPILILTQVLFRYIDLNYGPTLKSELITAAWETSWEQVSGFIKPIHYIAIPACFLLMYGFIYQMRKRLVLPSFISAPFAWGLCVGYISITTSLLYVGVRYFPRQASYLTYTIPTHEMDEELYRKELMYGMIREAHHAYIYSLYLPFYPIACIIENTYNYFNTIGYERSESIASRYMFNEQDLIVVFIVGESFRADHSPWNGYHRDTLPRTTAHLGNIVNFPYVKSYATTTITSIYGMLSDATCANKKASKTSFLGILKKHGFQTRLFASNTGYWYNNPHVSKIIDGKLNSIYRPCSHAEIESCVAAITGAPGKSFIMIEDGIGHAPYRHDPEFTVFDESKPFKILNINAFDNCLLQTDALIARVIELLKDKNAILLYSADHGQSFGEQGFYMHGGLPIAEKQRHVFSFVWYSDQYKEKHPDIMAALEANRNKALSHDYIYHSIISMAGIHSDAQDPALDITKPLDQPDVDSFSLGNEQPSHGQETESPAAGY